jgi:hypothetical protein
MTVRVSFLSLVNGVLLDFSRRGVKFHVDARVQIAILK